MLIEWGIEEESQPLLEESPPQQWRSSQPRRRQEPSWTALFRSSMVTNDAEEESEPDSSLPQAQRSRRNQHWEPLEEEDSQPLLPVESAPPQRQRRRPPQRRHQPWTALFRSSTTETTNDTQEQNHVTSDEVITRIELVAGSIIQMLDNDALPVLETYLDPSTQASESNNSSITKRFNMNQCRSFTSVLLVLSFCHSLLQAARTTTTREVYYFFVTHFRNQKECDLAIWDAATLLKVPRHSLGLKASPKGWFCGDIQLLRQNVGDDPDEVETTTVLDGRSLQAIQGAPISSEWLQPSRNFSVHTEHAKCILVVEKEGVYNRLSEDRFFDHYPCILVTGKGFPDLATRALVHHLHQRLDLPVRGLADCDPFGVMVLHTYQHGGMRQRGVDGGDRYSVPIEWVGLRPSQVEKLTNPTNTTPSDGDSTQDISSSQTVGSGRENMKLPDQVFQRLTALDRKRLDDHLLKEDHRWTDFGQDERRVEELQDMRRYKVELEALNWLGMDFCAQWVSEIMLYNDETQDDDTERKEWLEII